MRKAVMAIVLAVLVTGAAGCSSSSPETTVFRSGSNWANKNVVEVVSGAAASVIASEKSNAARLCTKYAGLMHMKGEAASQWSAGCADSIERLPASN